MRFRPSRPRARNLILCVPLLLLLALRSLPLALIVGALVIFSAALPQSPTDTSDPSEPASDGQTTANNGADASDPFPNPSVIGKRLQDQRPFVYAVGLILLTPLLVLPLFFGGEGFDVTDDPADGASVIVTMPPSPTPDPSATPRTTPAPTFGAPVGGTLLCRTAEVATAPHTTGTVGLILLTADGQRHGPPAGIGRSADCLYPIHTDDDSGVIRLDSDPVASLDDFLSLWALSRPDDPLLVRVRAAIAAGTLTVNGTPWPGEASELALIHGLFMTVSEAIAPSASPAPSSSSIPTPTPSWIPFHLPDSTDQPTIPGAR